MLNEHLLVRNVDEMGNAMNIRNLCVTSLNRRVPSRALCWLVYVYRDTFSCKQYANKQKTAGSGGGGGEEEGGVGGDRDSTTWYKVKIC